MQFVCDCNKKWKKFEISTKNWTQMTNVDEFEKKLKKLCFAFILIYSNFSKLFIFYVNEKEKKFFDAILH